MNLFTKQKQTYRYQKQVYGCQRGYLKVGERDKQEFGIIIYTLINVIFIYI